MIPRLARLALAPFLLLLCAPRAAAQVPGSGSAAEVASWLEGAFDSKAQSAAERDFRETVFVAVVVPKSRLSQGAPILYVEQADAASPTAPYIQRFYRAEEGDEGRVILRAFEPKDLIGVRGKWRDPSDLALTGSSDVRARSGCDITLRKAGGRYEGWTTGTGCPSGKDGARYATLSIWLFPDRVEKWDRGFDVSGKQVWGPVRGAYVFRRAGPIGP